MNCKEAHLLIAGLTGDALPETLAAHVDACPACAGLLDADARIRTTLRSNPPVPSPYVLGRICQEIAASKPLSPPGERGWGEGIRRLLERNTLMKITLPAAALLAALVVLPRPAEARTPLDVFNRIGQAVIAATGRLTPVEFRTMRRPDGSTAHVVAVDGRPIEVGADGTVSFTSGNGRTVNVRHQVVPEGDLSNLTPQGRQAAKLIEEAARRTGRPMSDFSVIDGKLVDRPQALAWDRAHGIVSSFRIDLDPAHYRSIAFGTDRDHLVLVPKASGGDRYVVEVDPKSGLPKAVRLQRNRNGRWVEAKPKMLP